MKILINRFACIALFAAIITSSSCREEDEVKTEEKVQLDKLTGTWTMTRAINGGIERTNEFVNLKITFGGIYAPGGTYTIAIDADAMPRESPWKENETWKFNTSYVPGLINLQTDLRLIRYGFLDPNFKQLLIEYDVPETGKNWQFFFSPELTN